MRAPTKKLTDGKCYENIECFPRAEEADKKEDDEGGGKVVCLVVEQVAHNFLRNLLGVVKLRHLESVKQFQTTFTSCSKTNLTSLY